MPIMDVDRAFCMLVKLGEMAITATGDQVGPPLLCVVFFTCNNVIRNWPGSFTLDSKLNVAFSFTSVTVSPSLLISVLRFIAFETTVHDRGMGREACARVIYMAFLEKVFESRMSRGRWRIVALPTSYEGMTTPFKVLPPTS